MTDATLQGARDDTAAMRIGAAPAEFGPLPFPICVDGRLLDADFTGVAHYAARLARTLARHGAPPLRLDATLPPPGGTHVAGRLARYARAAMAGARPVARLAFPGGVFAGRLLGRDLYREAYLHFKFRGRLLPLHCPGPPGVMHWTYPLPLFMKGWRNIYTVHDLIPLERPDVSSVGTKRMAALLERIATQADHIVTVTDTVRDALIARFGCDPEHVTTCHQAVDLDAPAASVTPGGEGHFLFCGSIEPRKNLVRLANAYRRSGSRRPLLIVGQDGWRSDEVRRAIGEGGGIRFLPLQSREALTGLMRDARALLFPSLAEGFGLPVAEAMALGTPVMASDLPVLREVAGDAALFVDPLDEAAMSRAIAALEVDDELCGRLARLGVAKATAYHASAYYVRLHRIYADVGAGLR